MQSPVTNKPKIEAMINKMLEFKGLTEEEFEAYGDRIAQAVENSLVVYMSTGKL